MAEEVQESNSEESQATTETQESQSEATETGEPKPQNLDKGLQRFQSRLTKMEKATASKEDVAELRDMIANMTPQQQAQAEAGLADDDIPQVSTLKGVERRLSEQVANLTSRTEELARKHEEEKFWTKFEKDNAGLDGPSILEDAKEAIDDEYPNAPAEAKQYLIDQKFKNLVTSRKGQLSKSSTKPSTQPRESTDGADIKPQTAASVEPDGVPRDSSGLPDFGF